MSLNGCQYAPNPTGWIDPLGLAKRGPKTDPNAPHNKTIRQWGNELVAKGCTIVAGGGLEDEQVVDIPKGGYKTTRRPDIIWIDPKGVTRYGNVGKTLADGKTMVPREAKAKSDLERTGNTVEYRAYDCPKPKKPKKVP